MKKPLTPPDLAKIQKALLEEPELFGKLLGHRYFELGDSNYYHWDKLRHLEPPEGIDHKQWWFAIKMRRFGLLKDIALYDKERRGFQYSKTDSIDEHLREIDLAFGGGIEAPSGVLNPETKDRYYLSSLIEEAITSSQLEGAATTRMVAKEMIRSGREPRDKSERMILNNFLAMKALAKYKNEPLSIELVFKLHKIVTQDTLDIPSASGRFRRDDEEIVVSDDRDNTLHIPPLADELPKRMELMCDFANNKEGDGNKVFIHPVIRSIILHFWLAYDHPFVDGNGRTARALQYWSMLRHDYWLFEYISISSIMLKGPSKYAKAFLYTETDDNDLTYFILYNLDVIRRAKKSLYKYLERKKSELKALEREIRALGLFNPRQQALINHAVKHANYSYTVKEHQRTHNITNQTSRTDLIELKEKGLLVAEKVRGRWIYQPYPDIEERLKNLA